MAFDPITSALIIDKGVGIPPNDMQRFDALSQEEGIKLTFTGPKNSYLYGAANNDTLACTPAGVMVRYSDTAYPLDINDGDLVGMFDTDYNPMDPAEVEHTIVGLVFEQTYYFTAFPFSADGVYNRSQNPANRATAQWVGTKGTINVTVAAYEGYEGEIGEYTITLVDQAESGGQNITKQASGTGLTQIGNLEAGKTYVVTLTDTNNLTSDPSDPITIVAGTSYNVTMTYREKYGSISVNVQTASDFATLGEYTITLLDQASDSPQNVEKQAAGKGTTTFENLIAGSQYRVRLGTTPNFLPPADSDVVTVIGGGNVDVDMIFAAGMGSVNVTVSTNPSGMSIRSYTISLVPTGGGSTLSKSRSGTGTVSFTNVPIGTYNVIGSNISHYSFSGGSVSVTGGQTSSRSVVYGFNATLEQSSWNEIKSIAKLGVANRYYSVGDTKTTKVSDVVGTGDHFGSNDYSLESASNGSVRIVHFDSTAIYFCTTFICGTNIGFASSGTWDSNSFRTFLNDNASKIFPDVGNNFLSVTHNTETTNNARTPSKTVSTSDKVFPPSKDELDGGFSYFNSNSRRKIGEAPYISRTTYRGATCTTNASTADRNCKYSIAYGGVIIGLSGTSDGSIEYKPAGDWVGSMDYNTESCLLSNGKTSYHRCMLCFAIG